ncbi:MAG: 2-oxo acid dehydrogenase subunit, partial [Chromatiaceae bacterium]|nr:2-oxo acid dehydrogenase subunit [Chromatiaceae bacterium]
MTAFYRMPSLGSDMEAGTLIEWVKQPGERLAKGDVIAVVETQKGAIEVEVFHDAVMGRRLVEVGQTVPVGTPMAELEIEGASPEVAEAPIGEAPSEPSEIAKAPAVKMAPGASPLLRPTEAAEAGTHGRRRASPAARRLARDLGLALDGLTGTGPDGAIVLRDVSAAAGKASRGAPSAERPAPRRGLDLAAMREAIAAAMARSKREIPHYYLSQTIDLTPTIDWLARRNVGLAPERRILMGVLFIKAVALTLRSFPELNGFDRGGRFEPATGIHVGSATAIRGGGLVAPAIHDADQLDLDTLMDRLRDLVARVRAGTLRSSELADPTITISSLGERGVDRLYGIIYPPQV